MFTNLPATSRKRITNLATLAQVQPRWHVDLAQDGNTVALLQHSKMELRQADELLMLQCASKIQPSSNNNNNNTSTNNRQIVMHPVQPLCAIFMHGTIYLFEQEKQQAKCVAHVDLSSLVAQGNVLVQHMMFDW